jgi:hypothetical protein
MHVVLDHSKTSYREIMANKFYMGFLIYVCFEGTAFNHTPHIYAHMAFLHMFVEKGTFMFLPFNPAPVHASLLVRSNIW